MKKDPCKLCGGADVTLVDGFYYCVECGTQDVNAQETVVEQTALADGTFAHTASRKITLAVKDGIEMSGEWHKWHTYNFILSGLADELVALGAKPSFKMKVLWVWSRYIKKFQVKDNLNRSNLLESCIENKKNEANTAILSDDELNEDETTNAKKKNNKNNKTGREISIVTKGVLLGILYVALNLDKSDLHMSHLTRFIKEGEVSIFNCEKLIPKELDKKTKLHWKRFQHCTREYNPHAIRNLAMSLFKELDLGTPIVPDLRKLIDNYATELCLPNDFKNLVFSLMNMIPCDYLDIDARTKKSYVRIPDFEGTAMAYVLVALKICFGLDCDYEVRLSEAVDKINEKMHHVKAYKIGMYVEQTERLLSFREWVNYLQFRKIILSRYCWGVAQKYNLEVDDYVFMEHVGERPKRKVELGDEITIDILNKITLNNVVGVVPKSEFSPSFTPMRSYTEVVLDYIQDPELKLLLSEDFTQYSLKYACESLSLPFSDENILKGVTRDNKTINPTVVGTLVSNKANLEMVYVRNCDNKNWLKTKPPTLDHITKIDENSNGSEKDSDHGYDSNIDCTPNDSEASVINKTDETEKVDSEIERKLETIEEEIEKVNIFDDPFDDLYVKQELLEETFDNNDNDGHKGNDENKFEFDCTNALENKFDNPTDDKDDTSYSFSAYNPNTFDREQTIRELVLAACKEYKIPVPPEYNTRKRKPHLVHIGAGATEVKRRKVDNRRQPGELKSEVDKLMQSYQSSLHQDIFNEIIQSVHNLTENLKEAEINKSTAKADDNLSEVDKTETDNFEGPIDDSTSNIENNADTVNKNLDEQSETGDSSVIEHTEEDNWNINDLIPKGDPNFDEKTHDIKQLYVKFTHEGDFNDILDELNDPELNEILDKKVKEAAENKLKEITEEPEKDDEVYDSEDDVPLSVIFEEEVRFRKKRAQRKDKLDALISLDNIKEFKYWFRHYTTPAMTKNVDMQQKFDLELIENCPSSFNFVINECAAILDCTAYTLYKQMQSLEQMFIAKIRKFKK